MRQAIRLAPLAALVPLLAACPRNPLEGEICTLEARPAVQVEVSDARTGAPIQGGYTVIARTGAFVDSLVVPEGTPWPAGLAHEQAGRYEVTVRKAGYREWRQGDVAVDRDECHVRTARLQARLEPAP